MSPPAPPFWELTSAEVGAWVRQLAPGVANTGGMLFPPRPDPPMTGGSPSEEEEGGYRAAYARGEALLSNLVRALDSASRAGGAASGPPESKRPRPDPDGGDAYGMLDGSFARTAGRAGSDLPPGAILSRIQLGGLVNGLAGRPGGVVDAPTCIPSSVLRDGPADDGGARGEAAKERMGDAVDTACGLALGELVRLARGLNRSIAARTEMDVLATTPRRIADLFCPEITDDELSSIRRRVHDTVVLGLGTHSSEAAARLEDDADEVPVAASSRLTGQGGESEYVRCGNCGNADQSSFVLDRRNGDTICTGCGTVVSESLMHEGQQFRKFEGEEDRNHQGDAPNPLFSDSYNMGTSLGGVSAATGAGAGGYGSASRGGIENVLRNAHAYTEMNISQFGKGERKTRVGYKDRQKRDAFYQMNHAGDALGLHEAVVQRAKELFAGYRDDRELVQQYRGVIAACLCEAFDQLSRDGRQILKRRAGEDGDGDDDDGGGGRKEGKGGKGDEADGDDGGPAPAPARPVHARTTRRNELHSASLAGKGGLLLDTTVVSHGGHAAGSLDERMRRAGGGGDAGGARGTARAPHEAKDASAWDLDDCKGWMAEASKSIAGKWFDAQNSGAVRPGQPGQAAPPAVPKGTRDELEGRLVEHTLSIAEYLESQTGGGAGGTGSAAPSSSGGRVTTPRVAEMGNLGIRWQHSHERGSGGRGGVGNSGRGRGRGGFGRRTGRTAGQVLILLTAKRFGDITGDRASGDAFHRELRAVIAREEARRRLERKEEATRARLKQMSRKPWLQRRVNG